MTVAFEPAKWRQSLYGDEGGGFWAIAADGGRVLWFNDIEEGFNVMPRFWSGERSRRTRLVQPGRAEARAAGLDGPSNRRTGPPEPLKPT